MKKLLLLLSMIPSLCFADVGVKIDTTIICFPIDVFLKTMKKYGEEPMLVGKNSTAQRVATVVYVNQETGAYTIAEMDKEAACVISLGTDIRYRYPKTGKSL